MVESFQSFTQNFSLSQFLTKVKLFSSSTIPASSSSTSSLTSTLIIFYLVFKSPSGHLLLNPRPQKKDTTTVRTAYGRDPISYCPIFFGTGFSFSTSQLSSSQAATLGKKVFTVKTHFPFQPAMISSSCDILLSEAKKMRLDQHKLSWFLSFLSLTRFKVFKTPCFNCLYIWHSVWRWVFPLPYCGKTSSSVGGVVPWGSTDAPTHSGVLSMESIPGSWRQPQSSAHFEA